MFGRIRPPSSSLDSLERPPSKTIKDDALSIYEETVVKLKQGSKRGLYPGSAVETEATKTETILQALPREEVMLIDTDCSSAIVPQNHGNGETTGSSFQQNSRSPSVFYLFARYKKSHHTKSLPNDEGLKTEDLSCRTNLQSNSRFSSRTEEVTEEECVSLFPGLSDEKMS